MRDVRTILGMLRQQSFSPHEVRIRSHAARFMHLERSDDLGVAHHPAIDVQLARDLLCRDAEPIKPHNQIDGTLTPLTPRAVFRSDGTQGIFDNGFPRITVSVSGLTHDFLADHTEPQDDPRSFSRMFSDRWHWCKIL